MHAESPGRGIGIERKHGPWIDGCNALMEPLDVLQVPLVTEAASCTRSVTVGRSTSDRCKQNQKDE